MPAEPKARRRRRYPIGSTASSAGVTSIVLSRNAAWSELLMLVSTPACDRWSRGVRYSPPMWKRPGGAADGVLVGVGGVLDDCADAVRVPTSSARSSNRNGARDHGRVAAVRRAGDAARAIYFCSVPVRRSGATLALS